MVVFLLAAMSWQLLRPFAFDALAPLDGALLRFVIGADGFSEHLIANSLERFSRIGDADIGGFMLAFEQNVHVAAVQAIDGPGVTRDAYPYVSHFGLQYEAAKLLHALLGPDAAIAWLRGLATLGMALTLFVICHAVARDFSAAHAVAVTACFALSPMFLERAASAYWALFLMFAPFALTLTLYPLAHRTRDRVALAAGCGALVGVFCVAGFLAAAALHVGKASLFFGDLEMGLQALLTPLSYSTVGGDDAIRQTPSLARVITVQVWTFGIYNGLIAAITLAAGAATALTICSRRDVYAGVRGSGRGVMIGFYAAVLASASWNLLALRHGAGHAHINWVTGYLFAHPFAAMALVEMAAVRRRATAAASGRAAPAPLGVALR